MKKNEELAGKYKIALITVIFATLACFALNAEANAQFSVSSDKQQLSQNEIGILTIDITNDSNNAINLLIIRIEGGDQIGFDEAEGLGTLVKNISNIPAYSPKELKIRFRVLNTQKSTANILAYYGEKEPLQFVSGTFIKTVPGNATLTASANAVDSLQGRKITVDFELANNATVPMQNVAFELKAPQEFTSIPAPILLDEIQDHNSYKGSFELHVPPEVSGEQKIILAYGYVDGNTGIKHYFEKNFSVTIIRQDTLYMNRGYLIALALIILIVAVFLLRRGKGKSEPVTGTAGKKN